MSGLLLNMCSVQDCASSCKSCQDEIKKECNAYLQGQSSSFDFQSCFDGANCQESDCAASCFDDAKCPEPDCEASWFKCQELINHGIAKAITRFAPRSDFLDESVAAGKEMAHADPNCSLAGSSSKTNSNSNNDKYWTDNASGSFSLEDVLGEKRKRIHCGCKTKNNTFKRRTQCPLHKSS